MTPKVIQAALGAGGTRPGGSPRGGRGGVTPGGGSGRAAPPFCRHFTEGSATGPLGPVGRWPARGHGAGAGGSVVELGGRHPATLPEKIAFIPSFATYLKRFI